jgi:hypothetical protein
MTVGSREYINASGLLCLICISSVSLLAINSRIDILISSHMCYVTLCILTCIAMTNRKF